MWKQSKVNGDLASIAGTGKSDFHCDENVEVSQWSSQPILMNRCPVCSAHSEHASDLCLGSFSYLFPTLPALLSSIYFFRSLTVCSLNSSLTFSSQNWLSFFCVQTTLRLITWYLSHPILDISVWFPSSASGFQAVWNQLFGSTLGQISYPHEVLVYSLQHGCIFHLAIS